MYLRTEQSVKTHALAGRCYPENQPGHPLMQVVLTQSYRTLIYQTRANNFSSQKSLEGISELAFYARCDVAATRNCYFDFRSL